ncbi:NineTeen Complex (NTC) component [Lodderomyces elongisporus]|uniref:NineTeen Complex (NTC) component n=1 Tax=Lodderomyces elongisporus TaxID=36914 RepID=UPI002921F362|nr:NineTeen Complex (NTC) component [Lodderomyces elongisporus]WLF81505.1 NineTeen Complex (NTC) component [Lodderomyces elongisporus]
MSEQLETNPQLRPRNVQRVKSLPQAEKWRSIVLGEISSKLTEINDPSVNNLRIQELNDDLNKLIKDKRTWEYRIKELGGNDYLRSKDITSTGLCSEGIWYFGRAKLLVDEKNVDLNTTTNTTKVEQRLKGKPSKQELSIMTSRRKRLDDQYYGKMETKELLEYEQNRSKELAIARTKPHFSLSDLPTNEQVKKWLVDKKREQLMKRLGL